MNRLAPALLLALAPGLARASESNLTAILVPIAVVGTTFGFTALMVGIIAYRRYRSDTLRHETIRLALEKGQPLPPGLLDPVALRDPGARDLRRGLVLLAIGLGLGLYLYFSPPEGAPVHTWSVGFIPGLMGLAYLAAYAFTERQARGIPADRG